MVTAKALIDEEYSQPACGFGDRENAPGFPSHDAHRPVFHEFDSDSTAMVILRGSGEETD